MAEPGSICVRGHFTPGVHYDGRTDLHAVVRAQIFENTSDISNSIAAGTLNSEVEKEIGKLLKFGPILAKFLENQKKNSNIIFRPTASATHPLQRSENKR